MEALQEIKKLQKENKLIIGTERTLKHLRSNSCAKVWMSSNIPTEVKEDVLRFAGMNQIPVEQLAVPNEELGVLCKKPFLVSLLSVAKE